MTTVSAAARSVRGSWTGCTEELTGQCDIGGPAGIGEEAVVADAVEPVGQDVDQEVADETGKLGFKLGRG